MGFRTDSTSGVLTGNKMLMESDAKVDIRLRTNSNVGRREGEEGEDSDYERHRKHSHLQKDAFSGKDFPNRSDPTGTVHHGL